jgi:IclR family transcriptional regulator, acetate operon repressor
LKRDTLGLKLPVNSAKETRSGSKYMVPVVQGTFKVLEELAKNGPLALNEVTRRTKMSKSTVFRILATLENLGYVLRDAARTYCVTTALSDLVTSEGITEILRRAAMPHMLELRDTFGETVNLGQIVSDKVVYIEVVPSEYALRLHERAGASVYMHASALGKAILGFSDADFVHSVLSGRDLPAMTENTITQLDKLLAELKRVRERGHAIDRAETSPLATCVAAPILGADGHAIAAISISGPSSRFNPRKGASVIESLMRAGTEVSKQVSKRGRESRI